MKKNIIKTFWTILSTCSLVVIIYFHSIYSSHYDGVSSVRVDIPLGASLSTVSDILKEKSLINSTTFFKVHARLLNVDRTIKAGRYQIPPHQSPTQILTFLTQESNGEISITIPEGFTIYEIDEKLALDGFINPGTFIAGAQNPSEELKEKYPFIEKARSLEGFLFPDTYLVFAQGFMPDSLIEKMLDNFKKKVIDSNVFNGAKDYSLTEKRSAYEILIMASLLEKEVRISEDFTIVSGLLWKRIAHEWPLQVDASVLYERELQAGSANVSRRLTRTDLQKDSPYNTYTQLGLPPGPIDNPGMRSIKAAANPQDSEYWFYITDPQGNAHYARTNEEHEKNKTLFLR